MPYSIYYILFTIYFSLFTPLPHHIININIISLRTHPRITTT